MAESNDNVFGAFGSVLGYIGAEAATTTAFERLLWPQRYYANFKPSSICSVAALTAMGGPVHKAALATMDTFLEHGIFNGAYQGHMLGTAFFQNRDGWTYTQVAESDSDSTHTEPLRNCFWARAMGLIPLPTLPQETLPATRKTNCPSNVEKAFPVSQRQRVRAKVSVNHIVISSATAADKDSKIPFVSENTKTLSPRVFLGIITSELFAILVSSIIMGYYGSLWALLFLAPLLVRLIAAVSALHRDELITPSSPSDEDARHFEVHYPQASGDFMIITGPPSLVLQFFRHYGHPKRDRLRELIQLTTVVLLGLTFPIGLLASVLWMPVQLQYFWTSYQLYLVLAMHVARYRGVDASTTTEAKIAEALSMQCGEDVVDSKKAAILFGHAIERAETIKVDVSITYHGRNQEGRDHTKLLLAQPARFYLAKKAQSLSDDSESSS